MNDQNRLDDHCRGSRERLEAVRDYESEHSQDPEKGSLPDSAMGELSGTNKEDAPEDGILFETHPLPIILFDPQTLNILKVNKAAVEKYGYSFEEFQSLTLEQIRPGEDVPYVRDLVSKKSKEVSAVGVWRHCKKDGTIMHMNISSSLMQWKGRSAILAVCIDVTEERMAMEEANRFGSIATMAGRLGRLGGWELNLSDSTVIWSDVVCEIHDHPPTQPPPPLDQCINFYHESSRPVIESLVKQCLADGTPWETESIIISAKGNLRYVRSNGEAVRDPQGRIVTIRGALQDITKERLTEQRLRASEMRFREIADTISDVFWSFSSGRKELYYVSPSFEKIWGIPCNEIMASPEIWESFLFPDDLSKVREWIQTDGESENPIRYRILRNDGEIRWIEDTSYPYRDNSGRVIRTMGVARDVTDIVEAEAALVESEERFRQLVDGVPSVAVQGYQLDGTVIFWNYASEILYGYSKAEALGGNLFDLIIPEEMREDIREGIQTAAGTGVDIPPGPLELLRKDGSRISVYSSHSFMQRPGRGLEFFCMDIDLTERDDLQHRLEREEELFRLVARATVDAVWDWDIQTDTLWWNDAIEELFGWTPSELIKNFSFFSDRIHPDEREWILEDLNAVVKSDDQHWSAKFRFRKGDGKYVWVSNRGYFIRDENGTATRMVGGMADITEQITLQTQLQQSQRMDAIGQLTGGIAHDFNNLLTVIQGNAELLMDDLKERPEQSEMAGMIEHAAKRGGDLTRQLLAFARKQALEPLAFHLDTLIAEFEPLLRRTLGESIEIRLTLRKNVSKVFADKTQLESALLNLAINARDSMTSGGFLSIETANTIIDEEMAASTPGLQSGAYVLLSVSDSGSGIPDSIQSRIFEPFFTTKGKGKGTGLGLSMVYGFIKQSNGQIAVYSEENVGTTFKLYLPRAMDTEMEAEVAVVPSGLVGGGETILVVEDDNLVRKFAVTMLTILGYKVIEAENGHRALDIISGHQLIDLLFTDIVMPGGMNGRQLADAAILIRPRLKILFTSGYSSDTIVHQGRLDPGTNLLGKPYGRQELAHRIREVLDHR